MSRFNIPNKNPILAPSLLSADFFDLKTEINTLNSLNIQVLHLDVMDGQFVPNISFGAGLISKLRNHTDMEFDAHLMVKEPDKLFNDFKNAGVDSLTVQWEACTHIHRSIQSIKNLGMKAGIALNPATPVKILDYILEDIDLVLIMSVNPGFGGQSFIESSIRKISELKEMILKRNLKTVIQVDGGVCLENAERIVKAGATRLVVGSKVFQPNKTYNLAKEFNDLLMKMDLK